MLGALAGAEALEIVVLLKDLSEQGLRKLETNVKSAEHTANTRNFSGWSKATKGVGADAEAAAGRGGKGGIGALLGGFLGLPGPIALAGVAIAGFAALTAATLPVYEKVERQEKALKKAFEDHHVSVGRLNENVDKAITLGEQYAFTADDTRAAIIKLAEAGHGWITINEALPHIMDLARAKNIDLAEAARAYELALMGNARALKDLGIALPKITDAQKENQKATDDVATAQDALSRAQEHLTVTMDTLTAKGKLSVSEQITLRRAHDAVSEAIAKHGAKSEEAHKAEQRLTDTEKILGSRLKLTKLDHDHLAAAQHNVTDKATHLKDAQDKLNKTQDTAANRASRLRTLNEDLTGAVGGQAGSITALDKKQATLSDKWEKFATKIGPALETALKGILDVLSTIVDALSNAFDWISKLNKSTGPEGGAGSLLKNISGGGGKAYRASGGHQAGGWVGLHGPEIGLLGEKGPEFVVPNHALGMPGIGGPHVTVNVGFISMPTAAQIQQLVRLISDHMHYQLGRAAPTSVRT